MGQPGSREAPSEPRHLIFTAPHTAPRVVILLECGRNENMSLPRLGSQGQRISPWTGLRSHSLCPSLTHTHTPPVLQEAEESVMRTLRRPMERSWWLRPLANRELLLISALPHSSFGMLATPGDSLTLNLEREQRAREPEARS